MDDATKHVSLADHASEWRAVRGHEDVYSVSRDGRIRRDAGGRGARPGRMLKTTPREWDGRVRVTLHVGNTRRYAAVHRIVAEAFCPGHDAEHNEVNHKDGNPANNHAANLEWVTRSENVAHAMRHGLLGGPRGEAHHLARLSAAKVRHIRRSGEHPCALSRRWGISVSAIEKAKYGLTWRHVA